MFVLFCLDGTKKIRMHRVNHLSLLTSFIIVQMRYKKVTLPIYVLLIKKKKIFFEQRMNLLDEKIMYGNLHEIYKKALQKALKTKSRSLHLIEVLEAFANKNSESEDEDEELDEESSGSDKENINVF